MGTNVWVAVIAGLYGLLFGSFANVVIYRVPRGESIAKPPSACPECGTPIAPRDNIPLVSWLLLRGRCRQCGTAISWRYPAVELLMGMTFAAVGYRIGLDWALPGFLLFAWMLWVVAVIDLRTYKIPNRLVYPLTPTLLVLMAGAALLTAQPWTALRVVLGGIAGFVALLVLALIWPRGMGFGDVKLAAFVGIGLAYLSWGHLILGLFGAFLIGGVVAISLLLTRLRGRKDLIPFGPYLSTSAILTVLVGTPIINWYVSLYGFA